MSLKNKLVIVVEDTFDDSQLVSTILEYSGVKVKLAKNGIECLELLKSKAPALIITDLSMPEMDGWEMLKQLNSNPKTADLPVVAVTAYYSIDVASDAINAGFDGFFAKPLDPAQFVKQLENILENISLP